MFFSFFKHLLVHLWLFYFLSLSFLPFIILCTALISIVFNSFSSPCIYRPPLHLPAGLCTLSCLAGQFPAFQCFLITFVWIPYHISFKHVSVVYTACFLCSPEFLLMYWLKVFVHNVCLIRGERVSSHFQYFLCSNRFKISERPSICPSGWGHRIVLKPSRRYNRSSERLLVNDCVFNT